MDDSIHASPTCIVCWLRKGSGVLFLKSPPACNADKVPPTSTHSMSPIVITQSILILFVKAIVSKGPANGQAVSIQKSLRWPKRSQLWYCNQAMNPPPKKLSFAEEIELLKQQKADAAKLSRQEALEVSARRQAVVLSKASSNANNGSMDASQSEAVVDIDVPVSTPAGTPAPVLFPGETQATAEDQAYAAREKAMAAALALYVGEHQDKKKKKARSKPRDAMAFCTSCLCTTPGEYAKPDNAGVGFALGMLGLVPGTAYFLHSNTGVEKQCTHCEATALVDMTSVQARTLCGEKHTALMADGWLEMRSAERAHTQARRYAIGKILVVAVVILGASLFVLRSP